jgi:hypothetical protein
VLRSQIQSNRAYGRAVRAQFDIDTPCTPSNARVARACAGRDEIITPAVVGLPGQVVVAIDAWNGAPGHRGQSDRRRA